MLYGPLSPLSRLPPSRSRCPEAAGQTEATHPKVLPQRRTSLSRRSLGQLMRDARLETLRANRLGCMQWLAALVPRPRLHLIRFLEVLAPNAKLRPLVERQGPSEPHRLGAAAQAHLRPRYAALPELSHGGAQDHRSHPGATGDREDPDPPGTGYATVKHARRGKAEST